MTAPETTDRDTSPLPTSSGTQHPPTGAATTENMATAVVNGSPVAVTPGWTVANAVGDLTGREITPEGTAADGQPLGIAVAVDDAVIPRSRWATTPVGAGQSVEIVTAVQGG